MPIAEFYESFWLALGGLNADLAASRAAWPHTHSNSYRGVPIAGTRIYALGNFKERYRDVVAGRGRRDVCVSFYTDHRDDAAWGHLLTRLRVESSPVDRATVVIDLDPGKHTAAQVLFVHRRIEWANSTPDIPALAAWMVEGHRALVDFASRSEN